MRRHTQTRTCSWLHVEAGAERRLCCKNLMRANLKWSHLWCVKRACIKAWRGCGRRWEACQGNQEGNWSFTLWALIEKTSISRIHIFQICCPGHYTVQLFWWQITNKFNEKWKSKKGFILQRVNSSEVWGISPGCCLIQEAPCFWSGVYTLHETVGIQGTSVRRQVSLGEKTQIILIIIFLRSSLQLCFKQ